MASNHTLIDHDVIENTFKKEPAILEALPVSIYTLSENHNWAARVVNNSKFQTDQFVSYPYYKPVSMMVDFKQLYEKGGVDAD